MDACRNRIGGNLKLENMKTLPREELLKMRDTLCARYDAVRTLGLRLDMSRGKPSPEGLDCSLELLDVLGSKSDLHCETGEDVRNYGLFDGIPEVKRLFGEILGVPPEQIIVGGNSSLNAMYDCVGRALLLGVYGGKQPWVKQGPLKFLCPVPGYDRHFAITEQFGFELVSIPMDENGPDMDEVERLVNHDPSVKGIWCVPKYGNPTGIVYSDETVRRFARLKPAADDFRIFWDNAYFVHDLYPDRPHTLLNIFDACKEEGSEDMVYEFMSMSKISFSGGGLSCLAASPNNVAWLRKQMSFQTLGFDKINQLRHAHFYKNRETLLRHMAVLADILRPKFEAVLRIFDENLSGTGIAQWTRPEGGYFISVDVLPGCAKRVVALCKEAGVTLTGAGAAFPYGSDPQDQNIRIAPTYPSLGDLCQAAELFCLCVRLAAAEKLLEGAV